MNTITPNSTLNFWNSVSNVYDCSNLTTHKSDAEMNFILSKLENIPKINGLNCLGVADGCRDPYQILAFLEEKSLHFPENNIFNDFSPDLLSKCKKRINEKFPDLNATYVATPIDEINWLQIKEFHGEFSNLIFIGCYDIEYIKESLQLYLEQKNVIGTKFEIRFVVFEDNNLMETEYSIIFDIDNYELYIDEINSVRGSLSNFVACSIKTNTGFISHYYDLQGISEVMKYVFGDNLKSVTNCGDRYIMTNIEYTNSNTNYCFITTCLNNVIGNISTSKQLRSLENIRIFSWLGQLMT